jgi:Lrp/AsnC family transcriptional regulator for asnA, asnC and gidA
MSHKVDQLDREIVELLLEDGRMPYAEISRRLGKITARAVQYRIERLIQQGVIKISAVVKPIPLGYPVIADIFIKVEPGHVREVAQKLADYECVSYVACSTGDQDISIQVNVPDNAELYWFASEILGNIPGVRSTTTMLVPLMIKSLSEWQIPRDCCVG